MQNLRRFSLRSLLVLVTLVCVFLGWQLVRERRHQRQLGDQFVRQYLLLLHQQASLDGNGVKPKMHQFGDLGSGSAESYDLLLPGGTFKFGASPDEFEQQLLQQVSTRKGGQPNKANDTVVRQSFIGGGARYYRVVRATSECLECHNSLQNNSTVRSGDVLAVFRVLLGE